MHKVTVLKTQRLMLPESSLCWPLLGAPGCKLQLGEEGNAYTAMLGEEKATSGVGTAGDMEAAGTQAKGGSRNTHRGRGVHANADATPSRQACTLVYLS